MPYSYEIAKEIFETNGSKLISKTYVNFRTPMKFKCGKCNKVSETTLEHFNKNKKCKACTQKKLIEVRNKWKNYKKKGE